MKTRTLIISLLVLLSSCASQQRLSKPFHTVRVDKAPVTVTMPETTLRLTASMQTVTDSLVLMSVQMFPGVEVVRVEATPDSLMVIDKVHKIVYDATFRWVKGQKIPLSFAMLQQLATAQPDRKTKKVENDYRLTWGTYPMALHIDYPTIRYNEPLTLKRARTITYRKGNIEDMIKK